MDFFLFQFKGRVFASAVLRAERLPPVPEVMMMLFIGTHSVTTTLNVHSRSRSFVIAIDLRGLAPAKTRAVMAPADNSMQSHAAAHGVPRHACTLFPRLDFGRSRARVAGGFTKSSNNWRVEGRSSACCLRRYSSKSASQCFAMLPCHTSHSSVPGSGRRCKSALGRCMSPSRDMHSTKNRHDQGRLCTSTWRW